MTRNNSTAEAVTMGQGHGVGNLLFDSHHTRADIRLAGRAVRERWAVPDAAKAVVVDRLLAIVKKETVEVRCRDGQTVAIDGPADVNAVSACRVLAMMEGQNQKDEHKLIDAESKKEAIGDTINIGCVGQIALGQDPMTPEDGRRQAQEALDRVRARVGSLVAPPTAATKVIDVPQPSGTPLPSPQRTWGLDDL